MAQKTKIGKNTTPKKSNHGTFWTHGHNSPADFDRNLFKPPEDWNIW